MMVWRWVTRHPPIFAGYKLSTRPLDLGRHSVTSYNPQSLYPNKNFLCSTPFSTTPDVGTFLDIPRLPRARPSLSRLEEKLSQLSLFRKRFIKQSPSLKKIKGSPLFLSSFIFFYSLKHPCQLHFSNLQSWELTPN